MRVEMRIRISGFRNLEPWPEIGETIDLPDHEAADLIAAGYAKEVPGDSTETGTDDGPAAPEVDAAPDEDPAVAEPEAGPDEAPAPVKGRRTRKQ